MDPHTANGIRAAALDAATILLRALNAHSPESVPADVREALQRALGAAWGAFDAVNAAVLNAARVKLETQS